MKWEQGCNQERANAPPEVFANKMALTYCTQRVISRDCITSTWTSSHNNLYACVCAASYWIKHLTNQHIMLPKTPNTEPETSFEALVVK